MIQPLFFICNDGTGWFNNSSVANGPLFQNPTNLIDIALDLNSKRIWYRVNGGYWNGNSTNNPTASLGGWSFSGIT